MSKSIQRLPGAKRITGLSRSTIYKYMAVGLFPPKIQLGPRAIGWLESDLEAWVQAKVDGVPASWTRIAGLPPTPKSTRGADVRIDRRTGHPAK